MFSGTKLGWLVDKMLRNEVGGIETQACPLLMMNLLLADASLFRDSMTIPRIMQWLRKTYGEDGVYRLQEALPLRHLRLLLEQAEEDEIVKGDRVATDYVRALLGKDPLPAAGRESIAIHRRIQRTFHGVVPGLATATKGVTPICVLGLKGSGKSHILAELRAQGEETHEVYGYLDVMHQRDGSVRGLPEPSQWENEPLMMGLRDRGWDRLPPKRFFVGSLLRLSEIGTLCEMGNPIFIQIEASNEIRHRRTRERGRKIEADASEDWLVELDAHRGGEWPGYETNDLGTLLSLAKYRINNDGTHPINELVEEILGYVNEIQQKGE